MYLDQSGAHRHRTDQRLSRVPWIRSPCELSAQAFGRTPLGREAPLPLRCVSAAALCCSCAQVGSLGVGDAFGVAPAKFPVDLANLLGRPIFCHEQRNLMALVKVVQIHCDCSTFRKREHIESLSRAIAYRTVHHAVTSLSTSWPEKLTFSRSFGNVLAAAAQNRNGESAVFHR